MARGVALVPKLQGEHGATFAARLQKDMPFAREAPALEVASRLGLRDWASLACSCSAVAAAFRGAARLHTTARPTSSKRSRAEVLAAGEAMDLICCMLSAAIRVGEISMCSWDRPDGKTALTMAAAGGRPDVVRWLLQVMPSSAMIERPDSLGSRALHHAALEGHSHVCEVLLGCSACPDIADGTGVRPLHLAAESGSLETCKVLIEGRCDVNAGDADATTPLLLAAEAGHVEVCSLLTGAKANPLASNIHGRTALSVAHESGAHELASAVETAFWGRRRSSGMLKGVEAVDFIRRTIRAH